jgi:hypothetical protein
MLSLADMQKYLFGCDNALAVTPSDTTALSTPCRRLYIGVTGNLTIIPVGGQVAVEFQSVPVGFLDVHATYVKATGTTATGIVALW